MAFEPLFHAVCWQSAEVLLLSWTQREAADSNQVHCVLQSLQAQLWSGILIKFGCGMKP